MYLPGNGSCYCEWGIYCKVHILIIFSHFNRRLQNKTKSPFDKCTQHAKEKIWLVFELDLLMSKPKYFGQTKSIPSPCPLATQLLVPYVFMNHRFWRAIFIMNIWITDISQPLQIVCVMEILKIKPEIRADVYKLIALNGEHRNLGCSIV